VTFATASGTFISPTPTKEQTMIKGLGPVIYPVKDLAAAKTIFTALLGAEPTVDAPYYVGYELEGRQIGLNPSGHQDGATGPTPFFVVDDIASALGALIEAGAQIVQDVKDVGGGLLVAGVRDADGNGIGLQQLP
jgi:predicted enzyme related to lactoylglutathione lyase